MEGLHPSNIPDIIADRQRYEGTLYTPLAVAYEELKRRRHDPRLERNIREFLGGNILEPLREHPRAVIARSVISPNFEVRLFHDTVTAHGKLEPLFLEYHADKFASNNETKRMIGRLYFYHGKGRGGGMRIDSHNIIDFSASNGEMISAVRTSWGQNLVDFHHEFFDSQYRRLSHTFYDASRWLDTHGHSADAYYRPFLALFIRHGILFENVLLNKQELSFTKNIFFPAFLSLYEEFGLKPLIVQVTPTDTEEHRYWTCYPGDDKQYVTEKLLRVT